MLLDCWQQSSSGCAGNHFTWEVSDDRLEINGLLWVSLVELVDLNEELFVGVVADTLEQPVDGRLEKTEVLILRQLRVSILNGLIVMFVHELNHDHEIFFLVRVNRMTDSCQICACIGGTQWLSDTSDHFSESQQVTRLNTSLHKSVATHEGKLEIDTGEHFTDASTLEEPVGADLTNLVWNLGVVNLILV